MSEDGRNGSRHSIHPDDPQLDDGDFDPRATSRLAAQIARRQKLADDDIADLEGAIVRIELGTTNWQKGVTERLDAGHRLMRQMKDQIHALTVVRIVWPTLMASAILFLGGFCAYVAFWLATHH